MTLLEIFDTLLSDRSITLQLASRSQAESLRVSLTRKFSNYKTQMDALGFLDPSFNHTSCSMEWDQETQVVKFYFREKLKPLNQYTILPQDGTSNAEA